MELRIAGTRGPVTVGRDHEPVDALPDRSALPAPDERSLSLEDPQGGLDGPIVSVQDPGGQLPVPGGVQQRDALRDREGEVKRADLRPRLRPGRLSEPFAGDRVKSAGEPG